MAIFIKPISIIYFSFFEIIKVYIDAGLGESNPVILTTITSGPKFPRNWRIRISQIQCGSIVKADQGRRYYCSFSWDDKKLLIRLPSILHWCEWKNQKFQLWFKYRTSIIKSRLQYLRENGKKFLFYSIYCMSWYIRYKPEPIFFAVWKQ